MEMSAFGQEKVKTHFQRIIPLSEQGKNMSDRF